MERFRKSDPCNTYTTKSDAVQGLIREALDHHRQLHANEAHHAAKDAPDKTGKENRTMLKLL